MTINNLFKNLTTASLALFSASIFANSNTAGKNEQPWYDLGDPLAIYSSFSVAAGNEGVNLTGTYGGYLNGEYKHKVTVEAMNDLEYYNIDYMLLNANTNSGFTVESTWSRDFLGFNSVNDTSFGVFSKVPLDKDEKLSIYPKLNLGVLWGDDIKSTTYIKIDATMRYKFDRMFWVGVTPTYTYAMKGVDVSEWEATLDAGIQLSPSFAIAGHVNDDKEFWFDVVFAF